MTTSNHEISFYLPPPLFWRLFHLSWVQSCGYSSLSSSRITWPTDCRGNASIWSLTFLLKYRRTGLLNFSFHNNWQEDYSRQIIALIHARRATLGCDIRNTKIWKALSEEVSRSLLWKRRVPPWQLQVSWVASLYQLALLGELNYQKKDQH